MLDDQPRATIQLGSNYVQTFHLHNARRITHPVKYSNGMRCELQVIVHRRVRGILKEVGQNDNQGREIGTSIRPVPSSVSWPGRFLASGLTLRAYHMLQSLRGARHTSIMQRLLIWTQYFQPPGRGGSDLGRSISSLPKDEGFRRFRHSASWLHIP